MNDIKSVLVAPLTSDHGISGIELDGWILTHGSILLTLNSDKLLDYLRNLDRLDSLVPVPRDLPAKFRVQSRAKTEHCSLTFLWRCPVVHEAFTTHLFSWSFDRPDTFDDKWARSIFLLLRSEPAAQEPTITLRKLLDQTLRTSSLNRGDALEIESVPFGNPAFLGSISRGVLSNQIDGLILTDASSVPGCEGAPVYVREAGKRHLAGMVLTSLSWCRGERVDYAFAADLSSSLRRVLVLEEVERLPPPAEELDSDLDRSLVVVKCGGYWGTGVILDLPTGTILTCSHVLLGSPVGSRIKVVHCSDTSAGWLAQLVYKTRDDQPYDVAVLKLEREFIPSALASATSLKLSEFVPEKGQRVLTMGFSLFGDSARSTWSQGCVVSESSQLVCTNCCVQSGASGGPIIDQSTGAMIGLVVSNVLSSAHGLYPRFNMAVPSTLLLSPLMKFVRSGDVGCLRSLESRDPEVLKTWNFYQLPKPKI